VNTNAETSQPDSGGFAYFDADTGVNGRPSPSEREAESKTSFEAMHQWLMEKRDDLIENHPITRRQYVVPTDMIRYAYQVTRDRVWSRRTGLVFYGETRAGKTTCAIRIKDLLAQEFKKVYVTIATARHTARPTDGHIYRLILEGTGHVCARRNDPNLLLRNVLADVQICTSCKHGNQYVLILDEVNLLHEADLVNLLELHNALNLNGIRMTTISFGQPEIIDRITSLVAQEKRQIVARFFRAPKHFLACQSSDSLKHLLVCLDEKTEWPVGSKCTYTQFFFPKAFSSGFRFWKFSEQIWSALTATCSEANRVCTMEIVALTIEWLYLKMYHVDCHDFTLTGDHIAAAIDSADVV
jgi:hypothetical protein